MSFDWDRPFTPRVYKTARLLFHGSDGNLSWLVYDEGLPSEHVTNVYTKTGCGISYENESPCDLINTPETLAIKKRYANVYGDDRWMIHDSKELAHRNASFSLVATVELPETLPVVARGPAWDRRKQ
jgi:hypothetical protein